MSTLYGRVQYLRRPVRRTTLASYEVEHKGEILGTVEKVEPFRFGDLVTTPRWHAVGLPLRLYRTRRDAVRALVDGFWPGRYVEV